MDNEFNILFCSFKDLPDKRKKGKIEHKLVEIIVLVICSIVVGCDDWTEIEAFCKVRIKWFRKFLEKRDYFKIVLTIIGIRLIY